MKADASKKLLKKKKVCFSSLVDSCINIYLFLFQSVLNVLYFNFLMYFQGCDRKSFSFFFFLLCLFWR
jgi:hypothetical protein